MKNKEALIISLTLFLTVVAWIAIDIYHVVYTPKIKPIDTQYTNPINISIDQSLFQILEEKRSFFSPNN
ncbi:MAG TPA: hypothetical protein VJB63_03110 [Patescibacteria group bacterium]|nr:hypothetical protein [Patescibacteria group bacterium]